MKKILSSFFLMIHLVQPVLSQENTSYGVNAGTEGNRNSFFGYNAGEQAGKNSLSNTAIGHSAMMDDTNGIFNTAVGASTLLLGGDACTAIGVGALQQNRGLSFENTGQANTAVGVSALNNNLYGDNNTGVGAGSLHRNRGSENTAHGYAALYTNFDGMYNTATGAYSLYGGNGTLNTANGYRSLYGNTSGKENTAIGSYAMDSNTTGYQNTANGYRSLFSNTIGYYNTALGSYAMYLNISGSFNMASGYYALSANSIGIRNSAGGFRAMDSNTTGSNNTAEGAFALESNTTGNYNSALGYNAGPIVGDLSNTTAIGSQAIPTASNQVRVGNTAVTSIGGQVSWTTFSDGRFKKDIKEDVSGLDFVNSLRPVSYVVDRAEVNKFLHVSDSSADQSQEKMHIQRQTGFVAQEVEAVVKKTGYVFYGVDAPENENDHYGIRYAEFVVPLVKAVQELSTNAEAQQKQIEEQKKLIEQQQKQIEVLLAGLNSKIDIGANGMNGNKKAFLLQNNPNPFTSETEIRMTLDETVGDATIIIYSLDGKEMRNIRVGDRGEVSVKMSGSELSPGMYLYTLVTDGKVVDTKRMVLTQ
ncbi:MAG TPA: tail fiber domain-containing protein [Chryseolinea sp.]